VDAARRRRRRRAADVPAHTLAVAANALYLGTDLGIFVSTDGRPALVRRGSVPARHHREARPANTPQGPALFAFTHGRGAWKAELATTPPAAGHRLRAVAGCGC